MKKLLWLIPAAMLLTAPALAADKEPSASEYGANCAKLEKTLVKGRDADATKRVKAWLYETLAKGPTSEKLDKKTINKACGMINKDKASLEGYKKKADQVAEGK
ncbi:MAG TPA: hypothetical protein VGQ83_05955 [Polyangia bacterium]|jgi:hypothetical protein